MMAEEGGMSVEMVERWRVAPSSAPPACMDLFLSSLDLFWRDIHYNQRLLFYSKVIEVPTFLAALRSGLSLALSHFYPFAGYLSISSEQSKQPRFFLRCGSTDSDTEGGAELVYASIRVPFSDLSPPEFPFRPYYPLLVQLSEENRSDNSKLPLLSLQVTEFLGGGVSVGVTINHVVADGNSLWHFMLSLAECVRGVPISKLPVHDRTFFKLDNPSPHKAYSLLKLSETPISSSHDAPSPQPPPSTTIQKVFFFSQAMIQQLKLKSSQEGPRSFYTSYESLCAHVWKSVIQASHLLPHKDVHLVVLVDCRKRVNPPLPDGYFGNVIHNGMIVTQAGILLEESLGETAQRIHEMIERCNEETLWAQIHYLELRNNSWGKFQMESQGLLVASSPKFPVYDVDFGWGPPTAVRPARCGGVGEIVLFMNPQEAGAVDLCLKLEEDTMARLDSDPLFLPSSAAASVLASKQQVAQLF